MSNKSVGNKFETEFCEKLYKAGYWVHNMTQSQSGQPADVIAAKNGHCFLIDCKNCERDTFVKSRIEENQRRSMWLWEESGNGSGWFAIQINQTIYMVEIWRMDMSDRNSFDQHWMKANALTLPQWLEVME